MKKLLLLLITISFLSSCSDDKEPSQQYTSFVFMQPYIEVQPNVVAGFYSKNGKCLINRYGVLHIICPCTHRLSIEYL